MNVIEARRARHLIIRLDRGEELPSALLRALDEAEARAGWIEGMGSLEAAEIALFDQEARSYAKTRRLNGPCEVVSLAGSIATRDGEGALRLSATLARESDLGLQLCAGEVVWARVYGLELRVTAFDDVSLARIPDGRTGLAQLSAQPAGSRGASNTVTTTPPAGEPTRATPAAEPTRATPAAEPTRATPAAEPARATPAAEPARATPAAEPARATPAAEPARATPAAEPARTTPLADVAAEPARPMPAIEPMAPLPQRPMKPRQEEEAYPEVGDAVTHFHFGECVVISSDGERIRLRQERDGRVREVSLMMLKIQAPTVDPATGRRHFHLARKN